MLKRRSSQALVPLLFLAALGCDGGAAPSVPSGGTGSAPRTASASATPPSSAGAATAGATASAPQAAAGVSASAAASPAASASVDLSKAPELVGADGKTLPQTKDQPSLDSPAFKQRLDLLWRAIVADDPALAEPAFFPVEAYELVKDIEKPRADWKSRLLKNFHRDIKRRHKELGPEPQALELVGVEVDPARVKWMEPGKEGNKLGYYRVTRNKLRYKDPSGAEKKLELTSLISWRGEWFVVHLDGFK